MAASQIPVPSEKIAEFCQQHGIRKLSLFGSVLSERFSESSDVFVLVEFFLISALDICVWPSSSGSFLPFLADGRSISEPRRN